MKIAPALASALLLLAGCSRHEPDPATVNVEELSKKGSEGDLPAPELSDAPPADGAWSFQASAAGSAAMFGEAGKAAAFSIRCEPDKRSIAFVRDGALPPGNAALMKIIVAAGAASYPALPENEDRPVAIARATTTDTFITGALAHAEHGFGVRIGDGPLLLMPIDPTIARVIANCPR